MYLEYKYIYLWQRYQKWPSLEVVLMQLWKSASTERQNSLTVLLSAAVSKLENFF